MKKMIPGLVFTMGLALTTLLLPSTPLSAQELKAPEGEITITGKKPARFNHQTHLDLKVECGTCHHDAKHQPRSEADIAAMDNIEQLRCTTCHNEEFSNNKLQKPKQIFHARCRDCHKQGASGKKGPTQCSSCHIKTKRPAAAEGC